MAGDYSSAVINNQVNSECEIGSLKKKDLPKCIKTVTA